MGEKIIGKDEVEAEKPKITCSPKLRKTRFFNFEKSYKKNGAESHSKFLICFAHIHGLHFGILKPSFRVGAVSETIN